jgi:broad specificity phosphatase PhoE
LKDCLFYFARHGETDWNAAGRWQGQTDIPLNASGRLQARALAARLLDEGIRAVGTSDLVRARETAEIVCTQLRLTLGHVDRAFRERAYGLFEGLTAAECRARHPEAWATFEVEASPRLPEVEPLDAVTARMVLGLERAAERMDPPALIVSHGRAIRSLVSRITGAPTPPVLNGSVYRLRVVRGVAVEAILLPDPVHPSAS